MAGAEQLKEHAELEASARSYLMHAGDFADVDYSGISDDVIGRAARCAQVITHEGMEGASMAAMIACYMQGAVDQAQGAGLPVGQGGA